MTTYTSFFYFACMFVCYILYSTNASQEESYVINLIEPDKLRPQDNQRKFDSLYRQENGDDLRKEHVQIIMSKALSNKYFKQKLAEAMPMLRDLSRKQAFELSKLIFAQTNPKTSNEEQNRKASQIFGSKRALVLKFVSDIAYFYRNSAKNFNSIDCGGFSCTQTNKQSSQLTPCTTEPMTLREDLLEDIISESIDTKKTQRLRRSAGKLLHKLVRTPPLNSTVQEIPTQNYENIELKLNTSSFLGPNSSPENLENSTVLSYEQIEDLAFAELNGTEIDSNDNGTANEYLPNPEGLVSGPRYRISNNPYRTNYIKGEKRKRIPVQTNQNKLLKKQCERFTASMCIKADDYPLELIMGSIRRHKNAMSALLAEYRDKAAELEYQEQLEEYQFNTKRREDGSIITPGGMCASVVRYARPQKARSASGEWKYIVNTGRHTQTLRLEKCSTPQESCSYLSHNYRSRCTQVYNYHRLLSWDKTRGLHVDIFKVPSCCSCQVDGYRETFPPIENTKHKDYSPVPDNNPYISINDEIDYEDEVDDDTSNPYQFVGSFNKNNYQQSELLLESKKIKTKIHHPPLNPTVGSYLSPPSDKYESNVARPIYYTHSSNALSGRSRKPYKHFVPTESRVDLGVFSNEESDLEVNAFKKSDGSKVHQKRTRLYSGATNTENSYQIPDPFISLGSIPGFISSSERPTTQSNNGSLQPVTRASNRRKEVINGKRINYNYHPIIDFFESHHKSGKGEHKRQSTAENSVALSAETSTSKDSRDGFGIERFESSWHPVVIKR